MTGEISDVTNQQIGQTIGRLLRLGVITAGLIVLIGGVVYLVRHGTATPDYRAFRGEPEELRSVTGIVKEALSMRGRGLIQLGLLLLIATPVARVAFSVYAFAREGDRTFVLITLIVLGILLYSLLGGRL
ncbi:MAG: DUF1634 domain-containing protein [Armatimonadota bacterium]